MEATPQRVAASLTSHPELPASPAEEDERLSLFSVIGMPFESGHVLAFRDVVASTVGPAFRSIWVRDPRSRWTLLSTGPALTSCARYWGRDCRREQVETIRTEWLGPQSLRIVLPGRIDWSLELGSSRATRVMTAVGGAVPDGAWRHDAFLGAMGALATLVMRAGTVNLHGTTPNLQHFRAAPLSVWNVVASRATVDGVDLGAPRAHAEQAHLGELWIPQRGFFVAGVARFEAFHPNRHIRVR
jgi:hypothetical protein